MRSKLPPRLFPFVCFFALAAAPPLVLAATPALPPTAGLLLDDGEDAYAYIVGLLERGLDELAIDEAKKFLADYPQHARAEMARYRLATTLFDTDRRDEALGYFLPLAERDGFEYATEARFRLGQCQLEVGQLRAAGLSLRAVADSGQEYLAAPAAFLLGEVAFQGAQFAEADKLWSAYLGAFPDGESAGDARRGLAWCAWRQGDAAKTVARCRVALEKEGGDELRVLMGEAQLDTGDNAGALAAFKAVAGGEFGPAALRGEGFAWAALGEHGKAAQAFARLADSDPAGSLAAEAALHYGVELLRAGDAAGAMKTLAVTARGGDPEVLFWLAEAESEAGRFAEALKTLARGLGAKPDEALRTRLLVARGDVLTSLGKTDEAQSSYESAGSDWALHAAAVGALNDALGSGSGTEEAERLARQLLGSFPASPYVAKTQLVLAEALFARGKHAAAASVFADAAAAAQGEGGDPADVSRARSRIAWCHYLAGDAAEAAAAFADVFVKHPAAREAEEAAFMAARAAREAGKAAVAEAATDVYLKKYPAGGWADDLLFARGVAREGAASVAPLERLVRDFPGSELAAAAEFELGERLSALAQIEGAAAHYRALVQRHADDALVPRALYGLGWCAYDQGDFAQAAGELERALQAKGLSDELRSGVLELLAWSRIGLGQPKAAAAAWTLLARAGAGDQRVFDTGLAVGEAWRAAGEPGEALDLLADQAGRLGAPVLVAKTQIEALFAALDADRIGQAASRLDAAMKIAGQAKDAALDGSVAEAAFFLGEAYFAAGETDAARARYQTATAQVSPVRAQALYKLGFVELGAHHLDAAEAAFATLTVDHKGSDLLGEALFLLGETRFRQGDFEGAVAPLALLVDKQPGHAVVPKARFRLGLALGELGRFSECEAVLSKLAKSSPDFPNLAESELWRGRALAATRKPRAARQAFDRTLTIDGEAGAGVLSALARIGIGKLALADGRTDEALSEFLKVAVLFADDEAVAEALLLAGGCLETLGDPANARARYDEVVSKHKDSRSFPSAQAALERLTQN